MNSVAPYYITSLKGGVIVLARSDKQASAYYKLRFGRSTRHTVNRATETHLQYFSKMAQHRIFTACIVGDK